MKEPRRWIVVPDMQVPFEDKRTLRAVEAYMDDHRWDGYINLGDFLDFRELSRFEEGNLRDNKISAIRRSYAAGNAILDRHVDIIRRRNRAARMVLIEGNHEYRIEAYLDKHPEAAGLVEVPVGLRLKERAIDWIPFWSLGKLFRLGNAYFGHGRFTGKYHAAKHADHYGVCFYYGHVHDIMTFPRVQHGNDKTIEAASLGCLCRYDQTYIAGAPTNWQQGFAVFHVLPDGYYQRFIVRIFRHRFVSPEGKVYAG